MIVAAFAGQELLRTFRRRETFWTLAGLAGLFLFLFGSVVVTVVSANTPMIGDRFILAAGIRFGRLFETAILCVFTFFIGFRAIRSELEKSSWVLLTETPARVWQILLGKALGLFVAAALLHAVLSAPALMLGPASNEHFLPSLGRSSLLLLFACGFIPEGMLYGWMGRKYPILTYALYPLTLARLAAIPLLVWGASRLAGPIEPLELLTTFAFTQTISPPEVTFLERFSHPAVPWTIALSWQAATGAAYGWVLAKLAR